MPGLTLAFIIKQIIALKDKQEDRARLAGQYLAMAINYGYSDILTGLYRSKSMMPGLVLAFH